VSKEYPPHWEADVVLADGGDGTVSAAAAGVWRPR